MFLKCGEKELNHIKVLGAYIGFVLGSAQMLVWIFYQVSPPHITSHHSDKESKQYLTCALCMPVLWWR
jgi:hypothetical protein